MKRYTTLAAALAVIVGLLPTPSSASEIYDMIFPVVPDPGYTDNFGDPRSGGRTHEGIDIMAPKMTPVVAVADGTVGWMDNEQGGDCCAMEIQHDDGYESWYIHLNNDTPGTDDGQGWGFAEGIYPGARVQAGQLIGWVGDSGNAESTGSHVHFELHDPDGNVLNPYPHLNTATRLSAPLPVIWDGTFWDDDGNIHEDTIEELFSLGITAGCDEFMYCPDQEVTRGQMATFLMRMLGLEASGENHFNDDNGSVHEPGINAIADLDIPNACGPNQYCPNDILTREEMALFMTNAYGLPPSADNPFDDVGDSPYLAEIRALAAAGITLGCDETSYCPDDGVTRAQMASFLIRAVDWLAEQGG